MFTRNAVTELEQWAAKGNRKPLILRGSRQVGKTTLVDCFAQRYENYLYVNFEKTPSAMSLFEKEQEIPELLTEIFMFCNKERKAGKILLFIDEIQNSKSTITKLRYFYEAQIPELYVIAAGSLLETTLNKNISFPVGRVEYLAVRPCAFNEFLRAIGENILEQALTTHRIPEALHEKTMRLFNTFTLIGGMPEVVANYAENRDILGLNNIYESLLTSYRDDVEKYAENSTMSQVIRYILKAGWKYTAQRITLGGFADSAYKSREVGEAFRTLEKTFVLELCYPTTDVLIPITQDLKRSPKLLWLDCGLVNYATNLQKEVFGAKDILDAYRGKIAEQVVAQELLSLDSRVSNQRNFWVREKNTSQAEVDFILQSDNKVIPIEVKSGHNAHLKSLHLFMDETPHNIAIRVWSQPLSIDEVTTQKGKKFTLLNVPFYYVGVLNGLLAKHAVLLYE